MSVAKAQNQAGPSQIVQQSQKKMRGRPSIASTTRTDAPDEPTEALSAAKQRPPSKQTRRRFPSERSPPAAPQEPAASAAPSLLPHHRHLATRTRQVPRATIAAKWTPLSAPAVTAVDALLADAARPVLHRLRDRDVRRAQAEAILRTFSARLRGKLVKGMPFPPPAAPAPGTSANKGQSAGGGGGGGGTGRGKGKSGSSGHEAELDFERTVAGVAALERALDPLLHGVALLRGEKEREKRALRREYDALRRLEVNSRAQTRAWREGRGREHVLVSGGIGLGSEVVGSEFRAGGQGGGEVFQVSLVLICFICSFYARC
jgi:hypothetical protein